MVQEKVIFQIANYMDSHGWSPRWRYSLITENAIYGYSSKVKATENFIGRMINEIPDKCEFVIPFAGCLFAIKAESPFLYDYGVRFVFADGVPVGWAAAPGSNSRSLYFDNMQKKGIRGMTIWGGSTLGDKDTVDFLRMLDDQCETIDACLKRHGGMLIKAYEYVRMVHDYNTATGSAINAYDEDTFYDWHMPRTYENWQKILLYLPSRDGGEISINEQTSESDRIAFKNNFKSASMDVNALLFSFCEWYSSRTAAFCEQIPFYPPTLAGADMFINELMGEIDSIAVENTTMHKTDDVLAQIEKLSELKEKGIITDDEFIEKKTALLSRM